MDDLPEELLEYIAEYLSLEDIVACSTVSTSWQRAFNINRVWKRFSSFHPRYFLNNACKLESSRRCFLSTRHEKCEEKARVLNELRIQNNILQNNFHISEVHLGFVYCDNVLDIIDNMGNHWLFISYTGGTFISSHKLQVWNLNVDPIFHTSVITPLGETSRLLSSKMEMKGEDFIFIYEDRFLLYKFSYPLYKLELKYSLHYEDLIPQPARILNGVIELVFLDIYVVVFEVTHELLFETLSTAITGLSEGKTFKKCPEQELIYTHNQHRNHNPNVCKAPILHSVSNDLDKILIIIQSSCVDFHSNVYTVKIFDVKNLKYTNFVVANCGDIISFEICGDVVSLLYSQFGENIASLKCYNADNSGLLLECDMDLRKRHGYLKSIPKSRDRELLVVGKNTVYLFDVQLKKVINNFELPGVDLDITVFANSLMLVKYFRGKTIHHEVHNFRSGQRLYALMPPSPGFAANCYTFSFFSKCRVPPKLIMYSDPSFSYSHENVNNKISVLNFW